MRPKVASTQVRWVASGSEVGCQSGSENGLQVVVTFGIASGSEVGCKW